MNKYPTVKLEIEGEIRFGPVYCCVFIDGIILKDRLFGQKQTRSKDFRYVALEEWLTTDYIKGPITRLFLIDFELEKFSEFKTVDKGFIQKMSFVNDKVIYQKQFNAKGQTEEVEVDIKTISNWKNIKSKS